MQIILLKLPVSGSQFRVPSSSRIQFGSTFIALLSCPDICLQVKNKNYSFPQSNPHATHEVLLRKTLVTRSHYPSLKSAREVLLRKTFTIRNTKFLLTH